jgi:hypothetical protein
MGVDYTPKEDSDVIRNNPIVLAICLLFLNALRKTERPSRRVTLWVPPPALGRGNHFTTLGRTVVTVDLELQEMVIIPTLNKPGTQFGGGESRKEWLPTES